MSLYRTVQKAMHFDNLNRLSVDHECYTQAYWRTGEQTERIKTCSADKPISIKSRAYDRDWRSDELNTQCVYYAIQSKYKKLIRRWDSEHELSLRRHCTRTKNTIDSCINSTTYRFLQHRFTKFSEITQCNGHYAVQGHSRSPILVPIESSYTTSY